MNFLLYPRLACSAMNIDLIHRRNAVSGSVPCACRRELQTSMGFLTGMIKLVSISLDSSQGSSPKINRQNLGSLIVGSSAPPKVSEIILISEDRHSLVVMLSLYPAGRGNEELQWLSIC